MMNGDHLVGFVAGVGVTALAIYWYNQNQERIEQFLQAQGMPPPGYPGMYGWSPASQAQSQAQPVATTGQGRQVSLRELIAQKEQLEDLIAEVQASQQQETEEVKKAPPA